MEASMLRKILIITVLVTLFPILLKVIYYGFVFFLFLAVLLTLPFFLLRKKLMRLFTDQLRGSGEARCNGDEQEIIIDVTAEHKK